MPQKRCLILLYLQKHIPIFFIITSMIILFLLWPVKGLAISTENDLLFFFPEKELVEFAIVYDHSVARTEVKDVFTLEEGEIRLLRTEYESFGAGLPTEEFENFTQVDGRYINDGINERIPEIRMRTGRTTDHRFIYNENSPVYFNKYIEMGSLVLIEEETMTRLESLFH